MFCNEALVSCIQYVGRYCREACRDTQTSIRLASHLVRVHYSSSEGHEFETPGWRELSAPTKVERSLGSGFSSVVNPRDHVMPDMYSTVSVWLCSVHSLAHHWQTYLSRRLFVTLAA
jgi:hypothetical protein